ncbi:MAG TPA: phytoene/squalene synthase family protein [Rhizomicrobium sp.]|nr:phytoene/squalene synthase family protein [Rhizomicrobium sp.]
MSALAACEAHVRRVDPPRYFSALFAPKEKRGFLFALYAFNHEIARVGESVREPMMGEIRLQWWRETIEAAREGHPRNHDVARALSEVFAAVNLPQELFDAMIDARGYDFSVDIFADFAALETYAEATSGSLMKLAARVLVAGDGRDAQAREAGIAYALAGVLRAIPFHASRNKVYLPIDLLNALDLSPEEIFAGRGGEKLKAVMHQVALKAKEKLNAARAFGKPGKALPAFLPASLVPLYLKRVTKPRFNAFRDPADVATHRLQWALLSAATKGRI